MNNSSARSPSTRHAFLRGGGKLGRMIDGYDWSRTALGPAAAWPAHMRTAVAMLLRSPIAMASMWGETGILIYNDAYAVVAGERHPAALGMSSLLAWPEAADFNAQVLRTVMAGDSLHYTDIEMTITRGAAPERVCFNLDYSPVPDLDGAPAGVLAIVYDTTETVRAQRWRQGEHERMRAMFEQAPGFVAMLTGPEHVFTLANRAYMSLVNQRDVLGHSVRDALPEAARQGFVALLDGLYATGETYTGTAMPFSVETSDGRAPSRRFLDFVYQPMKDDDGAVFGIFVQGADVTDRVAAEQAMRDSESTFRMTAQALPNQVWAASPDGILDWFNERVYAYSGARAGELDGNRWGSIVHPDEVLTAGQAWQQAVLAGEVYETQFRVRRHDGVYRWHLVRATPVRGADGALQRWIGTNTDIEDQKTANELLARQVDARTEERDRMWRLASDIMLVASLDGHVVAVNPAFSTLLGWREEQVIGRRLADFLPGESGALVAAALDASVGSQGAFRCEALFRRADGGDSMIAWTGAHEGGFTHAVGRDITDEREAAEVMRRSELALQQAQKMDTIGKLTGGVAHDFNNLLQVISGNLQLLATEVGDSARAQQRIASALGGVTRGAKLASYLLAFGRRQALEPKVVRIGAHIAAMDDMLRRSLGEEIDIDMAMPEGLWKVLADVAQVENAVLNLCINARDAMGGSGKLTIELANAVLGQDYVAQHADVAPGEYVMIAVSDTGSGMSDDVLRQAFDPFFSTKPEGQGTGLGLSMVFGFVKQSGGHVKIYSEVGNGTSVKLYLPRAMGEEDVAQPPDLRVAVGGTETILVVEDDAEVRHTVIGLLGELGYRVLQAPEAVAALDIVKSGMPIDLLFTDVVMPGPLRSPELARQAREHLPDLAVLFTSGYTENAIVHGGRLDAGVELLGKPYTRTAMARKIRHVLANQQQRKLAARQQATLATAPPASAPAGLRILLVEDDELTRVTTAELLGYLGHAVLDATDGESAIAMLGDSAVDVMITDIGLPGMSGEALASQVRARWPGTGLVFASGQDQQAEMPGAVILRKPYDMRQLQDVLRRFAPKG